MSKSIADQMMGLGLADKKQVQKDKAEKRKQEKLTRKHKLESEDESKQAVEKARREKAEHDRQLNLERQQQAEEKALLAQVKQILQHTRISTDKGDIKYNFADRHDNKIKSLYVTSAIQDSLANGKLAIIASDEQYHVVTKTVADKIAERVPSSVVFVADTDESQTEDDDPYKDFVIPDDLMW